MNKYTIISDLVKWFLGIREEVLKCRGDYTSPSLDMVERRVIACSFEGIELSKREIRDYSKRILKEVSKC